LIALLPLGLLAWFVGWLIDLLVAWRSIAALNMAAVGRGIIAVTAIVAGELARTLIVGGSAQSYRSHKDTGIRCCRRRSASESGTIPVLPVSLFTPYL
jgi:hypothetical protein